MLATGRRGGRIGVEGKNMNHVNMEKYAKFFLNVYYVVKFYANWENLQELMQSERSRTRRHCTQRLIHYGKMDRNGLLH